MWSLHVHPHQCERKNLSTWTNDIPYPMTFSTEFYRLIPHHILVARSCMGGSFSKPWPSTSKTWIGLHMRIGLDCYLNYQNHKQEILHSFFFLFCSFTLFLFFMLYSLHISFLWPTWHWWAHIIKFSWLNRAAIRQKLL